MIGFYNYTVILTYIGTAFGFAGICFTLNGNIKAALLCLMISGFCDLFDGKIASTMKRTKPEKRFGIQIDSLSDLICFGVLPAIIVYECSAGKIFQFLLCAVYVLCALIRLAWFNVDEEQRQDSEDHGREKYLGMPVTTSALILPILMAFANFFSISFHILCPILLILTAAAFITPFSLKKPGWPGKIIILIVGLAGFALLLQWMLS